ncbi:MAG: tetratricopeptide repeat protein [Anaerolineae bacterium]|nr:tetratricopeptide repeat protein [Anaerolineae bacterium]
MSSTQLYLLGTPRLVREGTAVHIEIQKALALLVYLAVNRQPYTRAELAALFWPELPVANAQNVLRRTLSTLRRAIGADCLQATRTTVSLTPVTEPPLSPQNGGVHYHNLWVDVIQFHHYLAQNTTTALAEALALYQGEFLSGFSLRDSPLFDEWQMAQGRKFHQEAIKACQTLGHIYTEQQEWETAVAYARRWLALDPLHEPAHRHLMRLYEQQGSRSAALHQYHECVRLLRQELDIEPETETTQLYLTIREGRQNAITKWQTDAEMVARVYTTSPPLPEQSPKPAPTDEQFHHLLYQLEIGTGEKTQQQALTAFKTDANQIWAAWEWATRQKQIELIGRACFPLALFHDYLGWDEAGQRMFQTAVQAIHQKAQPKSDRLVVGQLMSHQAQFAIARRHFYEARPLLNESQAIAQKVDDPVGQILALKQLVHFHTQLNALDEAGRVAGQYLALCQQNALWGQARDKHFLADAWKKMGLLKARWQDFSGADDCYHQALALARESGDAHMAAQIICNQGLLYQSQGQEPTVYLPLFYDSLDTFEKLDDQRSVGTLLLNIGRACLQLQHLAEARQILEESLPINCHLDDDYQAGVTVYLLGQVARQMSKFPAAMNHYQDALEILGDTDAPVLVQRIYHDMAACLDLAPDTCRISARLKMRLRYLPPTAVDTNDADVNLAFVREGQALYQAGNGMERK